MGFHKQKWFNIQINKVLKLLKLKIPLELVHFPCTGLSAVFEIIQSNQNKTNMDLHIISAVNIPDKIRNSENDLQKVKNYISFNSLQPEDSLEEFEQKIQISIENKKECIFVFKLKDSKDLFEMEELRTIQEKIKQSQSKYKQKVNYILYSSNPLRNQSLRFSNNVLLKFFNYYDPSLADTTKQDLTLLDLDYKFTKNQVSKIFELTGGHKFLVLSILRDLHLKEAQIDYLFNYDFKTKGFDEFINLNLRLQKALSRLPEEYIYTLHKVANHKKPEKNFATELSQMGIIGDNHNIRGKLLETFFANKNIITKFKEGNKANKQECIILGNIRVDTETYDIYVDDDPIDENLTENEFRVLKHLKDHEGETISREDVAKVLWGNNYLQQYSDWSIDKTISRIRKKIQDKDHTKIRTLKKRGFILD